MYNDDDNDVEIRIYRQRKGVSGYPLLAFDPKKGFNPTNKPTFTSHPPLAAFPGTDFREGKNKIDKMVKMDLG